MTLYILPQTDPKVTLKGACIKFYPENTFKIRLFMLTILEDVIRI